MEGQSKSKTGRRARRLCLQALGAAALLGVGRGVRGAEPGVTGDSLLIGQSIALQGGKNPYTAEVMTGIQAGVEHANRNGGVYGRKLVLRTLDDQNDAARAEANARTLIEGGAFILFGCVEGGPSTAVMKAAVELNVPLLGPMAGSPGLRRPHQPLVFPVRAEHREEFRALIEHGRRIGLRRVALLHADSAVGREHLANVEKLADAAGMGFGGGAPFKSDIGDEQLAGIVSRLDRDQVDLLINHGSAPIFGRLVRAARQSGARFSTWGVNSGSTQLAAALGPLAHGMIFSQVVPNPYAGKTPLVREYRQRLEQFRPGLAPSYGSLEGYLTAKVLLAGLRAAGNQPTRESLLAALERFEADMGGLNVRWRKGDHVGSAFVDLAMVGRDGRFIQ